MFGEGGVWRYWGGFYEIAGADNEGQTSGMARIRQGFAQMGNQIPDAECNARTRWTRRKTSTNAGVFDASRTKCPDFDTYPCARLAHD